MGFMSSSDTDNTTGRPRTYGAFFLVAAGLLAVFFFKLWSLPLLTAPPVPVVKDDVVSQAVKDAGSGERTKKTVSKPVMMKQAIVSKININSAGIEELSALPGIGPELAKRIITLRGQKGRFSTIAELKEVRGIGEKRFGAVKGLVTVNKNKH